MLKLSKCVIALSFLGMEYIKVLFKLLWKSHWRAKNYRIPIAFITYLEVFAFEKKKFNKIKYIKNTYLCTIKKYTIKIIP